MKEQTQNKTSSDFLRTDGGKTKSNAIEVPSISLPKGGGAIKGIDEKFSVNAVNGTSSFSIPLPFPEARGVSPSLQLSYNSGGGNGIFGLGWSLNLGSIKRKTDKELPQYLDGIDSDVFLFSEAEDLVPEFEKGQTGIFQKDNNGDYIIKETERILNGESFSIRFYRPRIEGLFARIERWTEKATGRIRWRVITKANVATLFGWTDNSIIVDPADSLKIFEWLPEFVFDDKGNCAHYLYKKENQIGFDFSLVHNKNRIKNGELTYTNLYPDKILYGNLTPYGGFGTTFPTEEDFMFQTVFDYGTQEQNQSPDQINNWDFRPDAFSEYRAGFEIRTTRLCKRVLLFHVFDELAKKEDKSDKKTLIKSVNFEYDISTEQDFTFLKKVSVNGYIKKNDGSYSEKSLPPMEFGYQSHDWNKELQTIDSDSLIHAPSGLDEAQYLFADLFNEGLSGILTEQANGLYYKHNLGGGQFEPAVLISPKPSFNGLGGQLQLADLDGDGGKQIVSYDAEGYFELNDDNEWLPYKNFKRLPNIDFSDPNTRMLDLNGDGMPEAVISEEQVFTWYASEGRKGFAPAEKALKPFDEEAGPHIVFADIEQSIYLADMSGDGLTDIVRIKNGEVCYWPNLGYGKFGAKVSFDNAPVFDHPDLFNPACIKLADIDGSGTIDIIYLGKNKFTCWKNLSGNRFDTTPFEIDNFPEIHSRAKVTITDLLGNGIACIVWSSPLEKDMNAPLKYIDLMNSKKPHIMVSYKNNLGKEVSLEYTPSTQFYIEDKLAGKPWVSKLHFPVHCVSKVITEDKISGYRFVNEYKYHHGYYDHAEREFRGFGMVEQIDSETFEHWVKQNASNITEEPLHQEPVISRQWFHAGAFLRKDKILNTCENDYWYSEYEKEFGSVEHPEIPLKDAYLTVPDGMDAALINQLSVDEWREAIRSCKGMVLRAEVFAQDAKKFDYTEEALKKEKTPFSVSTHNCVIELLQPRGQNKHAVFVVKESEAITYSYERDPSDPGIAHNLNIKLDEYGNVLESAAVVYPRKIKDTNLPDESRLPAETREALEKTIIIYTQNQFTNDVISEDTHLLRLPGEVKIFELKGVDKSTDYYSLNNFEDILTDIKSDTALYHEVNKLPASGKAQKRLIEHIRFTYYKDDLTGPLQLHKLESPALPFESYQLAYTPELMADIFGSRVDNIVLEDGKFTHSEDENGERDGNWWIRSGTIQFKTDSENITDAKNRFFSPISYTDPYDGMTRVNYYGNYFLFIEETEDVLGNKTKVDLFNFRTLSPQRMRDINNNLSEVISDELGFVKALAIMGKGDEADELTGLTEITDIDESEAITNFFNSENSNQLTARAKELLNRATTRFVYDFESYLKEGKPAVMAAISREQHYQKLVDSDSPVQIAFEYSNGIGEVIMKKVQAEPGMAKKVNINGGQITIEEVDTGQMLRWIGNGRTINNNKGNPVKQYEPYFSTHWRYEDYEELAETGVTPIMYYDATGRLIKTEMPDGSFTKVEFDSWKQVIYDANDTVLESDWYKNRINNPDLKEKQAAEKAAGHANTPNVLHFDTFGRPVLSIEHNKNTATDEDEYYPTMANLDVEGNLRSVTDARENVVMQYKYDMLGNLVYQNSMDTGQRWLLTNILGNPLRTWDERNHEFQYFYDKAQRPIYSKVIVGDRKKPDGSVDPLDHIFDRIIYGESLLTNNRSNEAELQTRNILGQVIQHYDTGGLIDTPDYDFKGQPLTTTRRLFSKYKEVANWTEANMLADLETEKFTFITETDALGRIIKQTAPDGSVIIPTYNEAGLLDGESVQHPGAFSSTVYIKDIDYNEKGQREKIIYGNDVSTRFYYDEKTFRLNHLISRRQNNDLLQDLYYTYDPVGNITHIQDKAVPVEFFNNNKIEAVNEYTYDALYRLIKATGRENDSEIKFNGCDNWNDKAFTQFLNSGDAMATRNYTQHYQYDAVGNILKMKHQANDGSWTRTYNYENYNNRLINTIVGNNTYTYPHHAKHGYITAMPHLSKIEWNFKEEVILTSRQQCNGGTIAETTWYQYDGSGQRIRKITENQASPGNTPTKKEERIYIAGYELYKKHSGNHAGLERVSLSLMDVSTDSAQAHRFVMIETRNDVDDGTEKQLLRYQMHNHLGSAALELDDTARIISYEEYHPFGTTAYQAKNKAISSAAKRYRYTGMERDEETGLEYHSARYYLPWLGRWLSADPIGIRDGVNVYLYAHNLPTKWFDDLGSQAMNNDYSVFAGVSFSSGSDTKEISIFTQLAGTSYLPDIEVFDNTVGFDYGIRGQINIADVKHGVSADIIEFALSGYLGIGGTKDQELINSGIFNKSKNIRDFTASGPSTLNFGVYYGINFWHTTLLDSMDSTDPYLFSKSGNFAIAFGDSNWRSKILIINDLFPGGNKEDGWETASGEAELSIGEFSFGFGFFNVTDRIQHGTLDQIPPGYKPIKSPSGYRLIDESIPSNRIDKKTGEKLGNYLTQGIGTSLHAIYIFGGVTSTEFDSHFKIGFKGKLAADLSQKGIHNLLDLHDFDYDKITRLFYEMNLLIKDIDSYNN